MRPGHGEGGTQGATFAKRLRSLKQDGSNILLVGRTDTRAHGAACNRLLGADNDQQRRRLYVFTSRTAPCATLPEGPSSAEETRIVAQGSADPEVADVHTDVVDGRMLSTLGTAIMSAVDDFQVASDLGPAELRVCFDSVAPLLEDHRSENVFRLLHMVTSRVRQVGGMGHYHLQIDRESDPVNLLEPLFDAIVEVRVEDETVEQQWHLRDEDVTSDWIAV